MKFDINIKNINSMQFTVWIFKIGFSKYIVI